MANVFKQQANVNEHPNRNNFDGSFVNNLTMKFGKLYPVFCKEVVPGDSFRINAAFGLRFMPLAFPVQSRMRAHLHFFYVRNKNLWKNWQDWISNNLDVSEHPHPYISTNDGQAGVSFGPRLRTSELADYLNVPTVGSLNDHSLGYSSSLLSLQSVANGEGTRRFYPYAYDNSTAMMSYAGALTGTVFRAVYFDSHPYNLIAGKSYTYSVPNISSLGRSFSLVSSSRYVLSKNANFDADDIEVHDNVNLGGIRGNSITFTAPRTGVFYFWIWENNATEHNNFYLSPLTAYSDMLVDPVFPASLNPIVNGDVKISALPFRAYESIYNAYYRNTQNDPFIKDGKPVYNEYITNDGDGADNTPYELFNRNYEMDFLTSSLPSPQQGIAPLVGMTALGEITVTDENGITTAQAKFDSDGTTITDVVVTSPAASNEHARTLMNIASAGMSINDFRATNALQRWLETNIRKGYRYVDFIQGHFGKSPRYDVLDMPEFIGGFSRDVNVQQVTASADTFGIAGEGSGAELGSFVGQAGVFGSSDHSINHYCDDYGFIMGILCVTPTPAYSQLLPKHFLKKEPLDYYFPEFAQLGLQPITYEEMPLQTAVAQFLGSRKKLTDTFGYQRPNYDLVANVDEVHGLFRTELKDFLLYRLFNSLPELGHDFLAVDESTLNGIFQDSSPGTDKILGAVSFRVSMKRPIPRIVVPNLGK